MDIITKLLMAYIVLTVFTTWCAFKSVLDGCSFETLKKIHDDSDMNWFGCLLLYILLIIIFPVWWVCHIIHVFVYWMTHVGRRQ